MTICDRCRTPDPIHKNIFIGGKKCDLCEVCYKDYKEIRDIFNSMEQTFIKNKTLKHVDFQWIDNK